MEQMGLHNKIGPYYDSTMDFVDELQHYLKIVQVCDKDHIADCFGYDEFTVEGQTDLVKFSDMKTGSAFSGVADEISDTDDFSGDNVAIMTLDGTSMILSWNKNCKELEPAVYEWSGGTNEATGCVRALMEVNGNKRPNKLGTDVQMFRISALANVGCAIKVGSLCFTNIPQLSPRLNISGTYCAEGNPYGLTADDCDYSKNVYIYGDSWANAVVQCGGIDNLPSMADLAELAKAIYEGDDTASQTAINGLTSEGGLGAYNGVTMHLASNTAASIMQTAMEDRGQCGHCTDAVYLWSSDRATEQDNSSQTPSNRAMGRYFGKNYTNSSQMSRGQTYFSYICKK